MNKLEKNIVPIIFKKAKKKDGVIFIVSTKIGGEGHEINLKIRRYSKGSYLYYFGMENDYFKESPTESETVFSNIFSDVEFKKEFKTNLLWDNSYFKIWMYKGSGDGVAVIESFLSLKFKKWIITRILD